MLLFSERRFQEGNKLLEQETKDPNEKSASWSWKLLKGYELAGCFDDCLELANEMCEKAKNSSPILHPFSIDAIITSLCRMWNYRKVKEYYALATQNHVKLELTTIDNMIRLWVKTNLWSTVLDGMRERAREENIELSHEEYALTFGLNCSELFLQWKAKTFFYRQAGLFFSKRLVMQNARFFVQDEDEIRTRWREM